MSFNNEEYADAVLSDLELQEQSDLNQEKQTEEILGEAIQRIEEANLLKLLINAEVFAPNSASPVILASVKRKLKQWALGELETLLGIKSPKQEVQTASTAFDKEEEQALKILAAKVLKRDVTQATLSVREPSVVAIGASAEAKPALAQVAPSVKAKPIKQTEQSSVKATVDGQVKDLNPNNKGHKITKPAGSTKQKRMPTANEAMQIAAAHADASGLPGQQAGSLIATVIQGLTGGNTVAVLNDDTSNGGVNERF